MDNQQLSFQELLDNTKLMLYNIGRKFNDYFRKGKQGCKFLATRSGAHPVKDEDIVCSCKKLQGAHNVPIKNDELN